MKLIIDIPEKVYNAVTHIEFDASLVVNEMRKSIANGTPLPKRHGRLIDADVLENVWHEEFLKGMSISAGMVNTFNNAPTIIEADKETE